MNLYTAYYSSPVGLLRLQCSDKYIKTVNFSDPEGEIQNDEHKLLHACAKQLDEYFAGKRKQFTLPINQDGTEFQTKVWDLLSKIPYGKTITLATVSDGSVLAVKGNILAAVPASDPLAATPSNAWARSSWTTR